MERVLFKYIRSSWTKRTTMSSPKVSPGPMGTMAMFDWQYQTFILTYWQKADRTLMPRLIKTIIDSENVRLNGLVARGFLLGAKVKFLKTENPLTDLMQGIMRVHSYITPPPPMQECDCIFEYDVNNFKTLFEAVA